MNNIKSVIRFINLNLFILVFGLFITGCATRWTAYPGSTLPDAQVGIVRPYYSIGQGFVISMIGCDDVKKNKQYDELALLPGKHTITFSAVAPVGVAFREIGRCNAECYIESGGKYLATGMMLHPAKIDRDPLSGRQELIPGTLSVDIVRQK
jgi:hypothetical protein